MTGTMLPSVWQIRDVADVESLCRGVLRELAGANYERRTARTPAAVRLEPVDWHDSLAFLLGEVVILEQRFDQAYEGIEFRPWLYQRLRWALIDEWRRRFGRQGQHRVQDTGAALQVGRDLGIDDDEPFEDLRVDRLREPAGGDPADRTDADRWLDADGDRDEPGPLGGLRRITDPGAAAGAAEPGDLSSGRCGRGVESPHREASFVDCGCGWRSYRQAPNGVSRWHWDEACGGCGRAFARARRIRSLWRNRAKHLNMRARIHRAGYLSPADLREIVKRDGSRCVYCDRLLDYTAGAEGNGEAGFDHIIRLVDGGSHSYENVACACRGCNQRNAAHSQTDPEGAALERLRWYLGRKAVAA